MKKTALAALALLLCLSMCSCKTVLRKAKEYATGTEESTMPADYLETRENGEYSYEVYIEYIRLTGYLGEETEITLPSEIDGRPVKVIGAHTFFEKAKVTSVTIPSSVTTIDESAFYYADALLSVDIPDTVTEIGKRAFGWCNSLAEVTVGAGVTAIPDFCFNHCIALETVTFKGAVASVGVRAFSFCDALKDISFPESAVSVGELAFESCAALEFAEFKAGDISFGKDVFRDSALVTVVSPEGSSAKAYCAENSLRWSTSRSVEATVPAKETNAASESRSE